MIDENSDSKKYTYKTLKMDKYFPPKTRTKYGQNQQEKKRIKTLFKKSDKVRTILSQKKKKKPDNYFIYY